MRHRVFKISAVIIVAIASNCLFGQEVTITSGGNASNEDGSVSYSVGQVICAFNVGTNGSEAQGVQQPYEISGTTGINEAESIILDLCAYPNPTNDYLILKVDNDDYKNLSYQLFDNTLRLLENMKVRGNETNIPVSNLVPATYILEVCRNNKKIISLKFLKINRL